MIQSLEIVAVSKLILMKINKVFWVAAFCFMFLVAAILGKHLSFSPEKTTYFKVCMEQSGSNELCRIIAKTFFKDNSEIQEFSPSLVDAPRFPIDSKIRFLAFNDPNQISAMAYCYFVFRRWFDPSSLSPKQLAMGANGFALLEKELKGYSKWLIDSEKGKSCIKQLKSNLSLTPIDLDKEMEGYISIIAINPIAGSRLKNAEAVLKDTKLTINHERIHAIHVSCEKIDKQAQDYWKKLSPEKKAELARTHTNYNWDDEIVAVREAFAFKFEKDPQAILELSKNCEF